MELGKFDLEEARRFLEALGGGTFTFQTVRESPDSSGLSELDRVRHGTLAMRGDELARLNTKGAGIFVMVALGDGKGRKNKNVTKIRAVFVDLDGAPLEPLLTCAAPPHIVVETSPGRYHAYWLMKDCSPQQFRSVQRTLAVRFNGDPSVCDPARVMRLPGFWHQKAAPFQTRIDQIVPDLTAYNLATLIEKLNLRLELSGKPKRYGGKDKIPEGERNSTLHEMAYDFSRTGFPPARAKERLTKVNASRCLPPLGDAELQQICESAYRASLDTFIRVSHAFVDSGMLYGLGKAEKDVLFYLWRQYNGYNNENLSVVEADLKAVGISRASARRGLKKLLAKGLIRVTRRGTFAGKGGAKTCSLYALSDTLLNQAQIETDTTIHQSQNDVPRVEVQGKGTSEVWESLGKGSLGELLERFGLDKCSDVLVAQRSRAGVLNHAGSRVQ